MIDLNDLRHSINRALNLGRYQIVVKTQGGEQVPASITLDLLERDDDGFAECVADQIRKSTECSMAVVLASAPTITPEGDALVDTVTDDHGPAVPAQPVSFGLDLSKSPDFTVYEFSLQEHQHHWGEATLDDVALFHAPDMEAAKYADYVHVYDRVTRERRTLKRPDPMPPFGPLTSTERLKAGDVLRIKQGRYGAGEIRTVAKIDLDGMSLWEKEETERPYNLDCYDFVARPGVWMPWGGGENPVPGMRVKIRYDNNPETGPHASDLIIWSGPWDKTLTGSLNVAAYMVVDPSPVSSDT